jgi:hypothetical protein
MGPCRLRSRASGASSDVRGTVVEFNSEEGVWVGNFQPGLGGLQFAGLHPNGLDVVVIAAGDLWIVNPRKRP